MSEVGQGGAVGHNAWEDWLRGVAFIRAKLQDYVDRQFIRPDQLPALEAHYQTVMSQADEQRQQGRAQFDQTNLLTPVTCWQCQAADQQGNYCRRCGMILGDPLVDRLRYQRFFRATAERLFAAGLIELHQLHAVQASADDEIRELSLQLKDKRLSGVEMNRLRREARSDAARVRLEVVPNDSTPPPLPGERRNWLEVLLDPQSIQWLLASGGLLVVVGLVIYLASVGLFKNPVFVASVMGVSNVALLAGGWALLLRTKMLMAGRAVTLLACLAMPLHLWFYHAQGLSTLDGHLWVPAVLICGLYAASAWVLKDQLFVYVMMAGVTMTGLLILGDLHKLQEIISPSMLLMVLGLIAIHVHRAFTPQEESPFSQQRFGMAFFFSGQALLAGSLGLLLGAQIVGWLWGPVFGQVMSGPRPELATVTSQKALALAIVIAGAYGWIYSMLAVHRRSLYAYLAAGALLWMQVLLVDLWSIELTPGFLIAVLAGTALPAIIGQKLLDDAHPLSRTLRTLGVLLVWIAVAIALVCHFRATAGSLGKWWPYDLNWTVLISIALACLAARMGAWVNLPKHPQTADVHFLASAAGLIVLVAGGLWMSGLTAWHQQAPVLALVPIGYLIASAIYGDRPSARPVFVLASAAMVVILFFTLTSALRIAPRVVAPVTGETLNLWLALIALEAAVFYAAIAIWFGRPASLYFATAAMCLSLWQLFGYFSLPTHTFINAYALVGLGLLVVYRIAVLDQAKRQGLSLAAFICGNALLALAVVVTALMTLTRLLGDRIDGSLLGLTSGMVIIAAIASLLTRSSAWRRFHVLSIALMAALTVICLQKRLDLSAGQNLELFLIVTGVVMLIVGHVSALRHRNTSGDVVNFGLPIGSLLICLPLAVAMLYYRFGSSSLSLPNELGLITASIMLFVSGVLLKFRATTLVGGFFAAMHLIILMVHAGMRAQLTLGIYLLIGGGAIFIVGLSLAIFRQRLLDLPDRIRAREGIFRVLSWR